MDARMFVRLGAALSLAIIAAAAGAAMVRREDGPPSWVVRPLQTGPHALREGQRRCQQLGEAGARDAECLQVWAATRDRFLRPAPAVPFSDLER